MILKAVYSLPEEIVKGKRALLDLPEEQIHEELSHEFAKEIMIKSKLPVPVVRDGVYYWEAEIGIFTIEQYKEIVSKLKELEVFKEICSCSQDLVDRRIKENLLEKLM